MPVPQWYNQRVAEDLKREIAWVIANDLRDPRLPTMITVTDIKLAGDTRNATVSVSFLGSDDLDMKEALAALTHAAPYIQRAVAKKVKIKNFPRICFRRDAGYEHTLVINNLLEQVKDDLARD